MDGACGETRADTGMEIWDKLGRGRCPLTSLPSVVFERVDAAREAARECLF